VSGLANGTAYSCSVKAFNAVGAGPSSATVNVTPASGIVLALTGVVSRKVHVNAGPWDLALNTQPITGTVVVEPRSNVGGHKIVFQFNDTLFAAGAATAVNASGTPVGTVTRVISGNAIEVSLAGVPDCTRLTVSVPGVNGSMNVSVNVAFLLGDVDNNYRVDSTDILRIKGKFTSGSALTAANFIYDLDLSGGVSQSDVNAAKNNTSDPGV
jgi:hypothetical protein